MSCRQGTCPEAVSKPLFSLLSTSTQPQVCLCSGIVSSTLRARYCTTRSSILTLVSELLAETEGNVTHTTGYRAQSSGWRTCHYQANSQKVFDSIAFGSGSLSYL